jgi:hypothetical protein
LPNLHKRLAAKLKRGGACQTQREQEEWERTKHEKIAAWKRGEDVRLRIQYSEALLRVKGDNVETSMHVSVPVSGPAGAARLFRFLVALKTSGRTYSSNGHSERIGATPTGRSSSTLLWFADRKRSTKKALTASATKSLGLKLAPTLWKHSGCAASSLANLDGRRHGALVEPEWAGAILPQRQ